MLLLHVSLKKLTNFVSKMFQNAVESILATGRNQHCNAFPNRRTLSRFQIMHIHICILVHSRKVCMDILKVKNAPLNLMIFVK